MTDQTTPPPPPSPYPTARHTLRDDGRALDLEELPPRPRRRLLGAGANRVQIGLLAVLLIACGFIGGVLVEKGQTSSGASTGGELASALASLRSSRAGSGSAAGGPAAAGSGGGAGGFAGGGLRGRLAGGGATVGEVAYISGSTLYVSDFEGNTVKVTTSAGSTITRTVSAHLHDIHPGETVLVRGSKSATGTVSAESISVGSGGGVGGGFGGGLFGSATRSPGGAAGKGGGGEAPLFGR